MFIQSLYPGTIATQMLIYSMVAVQCENAMSSPSTHRVKVVTIMEPVNPIWWCDWCGVTPEGSGYKHRNFFGKGPLAICVQCKDRLVKERPNDVTILYE